MIERNRNVPPLEDDGGARDCVVNSIISADYFGSLFMLTLGSARDGVGDDGQLQRKDAIVARLRFDLEMAKIIRDRLDHLIGVVSPPANVKPN